MKTGPISGRLTSTDTYPTFTGTACSPVKSGKPTLDFAGTGRSPPVPETRKQSSSDENQFFRLSVGSAAFAVFRQRQLYGASISGRQATGHAPEGAAVRDTPSQFKWALQRKAADKGRSL